MSRLVSVGIDIGTYHIKVVAAESPEKNSRSLPRVVGCGFAESKGLRHGYIVNDADTIGSVKHALRQAEKSAGVKIKRVFMSVGGIGLGSFVSHGSVMISRADSEVTDIDIQKVIEASEETIPVSYSTNRRIIHTIPLQYKIDGRPVLGKPEGMRGSKLEARVLFITSIEQHLNDLISAIEDCGVQVEDVTAAPIAASLVTLTKTQKMAGCVLANVGAETVSIAVFENGIPQSLEVFPIGSTDITNDIALGLKVPIEEAEQIKLGTFTGTSVPKKKLEEIIDARLSDIFELVDAHLKKIGRSGLLPAGVIITGGGAGLGNIDLFAKNTLKLPSRVGMLNVPNQQQNQKISVKDASWSVAYGLCILGLNNESEPMGMRFTKATTNKILGWFKQFLP